MSESDRAASIMRRFWPLGAVAPGVGLGGVGGGLLNSERND